MMGAGDGKENGTSIDLSGRSLSSLSDELLKDIVSPTSLNISNNEFQQLALSNSSTLAKCKEVIADFNKFTNLTAFLPFARTLERLDLRGNQLRKLEEQLSFLFLKELDLSQNHLESFSSKPFPSLKKLVLSHNELSELPDVLHSSELQFLNLDGNRIRSLSDISKKVPTSLQEFSIRENLIDDLCEITFLSSLSSLETISVKGNPCLDSAQGVFNYRSYIYASTCTENGSLLKIIDEEPLTEDESIAGEEIFIGGRKYRFLPGNQDKLIAFLTTKCPIDVTSKPKNAREGNRLAKILEKKRELDATISSCGSPTSSRISNNTINTSYTIHSPYSEWSKKLSNNLVGNKENVAPNLKSPNTNKTPSTMSSRSQATQLFEISPIFSPTQSSRTNVSSMGSRHGSDHMSLKSEKSSATQSETSTPKTRRSRTAILLPNATRSEPSVNANKEESISELKEIVRQQTRAIKNLQEQVETIRDLEQQIEKMTDINEALTENLETLNQQYQEIQAKMSAWQLKMTSAVVPVPEKLRIRHDGEGVASIEWEIHPVKGYHVIVDGEVVGKVRGWKNAAKVTEMAPGQHSLQLAAISWDDTIGVSSNPVNIHI